MPIPGSTFPAFLLYVILGTATLCSLGIALSAFTPTPDAASTIAPFSVVMLAFFSGIWIPVDQLPNWLETVGKVFPLYHLALGLQTLARRPARPAAASKSKTSRLGSGVRGAWSGASAGSRWRSARPGRLVRVGDSPAGLRATIELIAGRAARLQRPGCRAAECSTWLGAPARPDGTVPVRHALESARRASARR